MSSTCYNLYPGPSALPEQVREEIIAAIRNFSGTGVGILEISHRSTAFIDLIEQTKALLRAILLIPKTHEIVFTTGGATQQFSMVALNLLNEKSYGNYLVTGSWSQKALAEASRYGQTHLAASSASDNFRAIPKTYQTQGDEGYLHYTSNNTIYGTQYHFTPEASKNLRTICDASSDFCSMPIDFSKIDLLYAGAQKNVGCAGVTVVIADRSVLELELEHAPKLLQYNTYLSSNSLHNTPPSFAIYTLFAMLRWINEQGGVAEMNTRARQRSTKIYQVIDSHSCFLAHAVEEDRSLLNICFNLADKDETAEFLAEAEKIGLVGLAGHRILGGIRASLYNGVNPAAQSVLVRFLELWAKNH
ncbi:UNVERIFIED_CONTAM: hypothetical protein GTU68_052810 [Idotea baltica]|nr:hypothetical protein [Idotea baltica]